MADPIRLMGSILTVLDAATKITRLVVSAKSAPTELLAVSNELNDLIPVLMHLQRVIGKCNPSHDILKTLQNSLNRAATEVLELQAIVSQFSREDGLVGRKQMLWLRHRHEISARQTVFRKTKLQISLLLATENLYNASINRVAFEAQAAEQARLQSETIVTQRNIAAQLQQLQIMMEKSSQRDGLGTPATTVVSDIATLGTDDENMVSISVGRCKRSCRCHCHIQWNVNLRNAIFASFKALTTRRCLPQCTGARKEMKLQFTFFFPHSLLARAFTLYIGLCQGEPSMSMTMRPVLPIGSPIFTGAENNDVKAILSLVKDGISPNVLTEYGQTAIGFALNKRRKEAVQLLLQAGANVTISSGDNVSALHEAREIIMMNPDDEFSKWLTAKIPAATSLEDLEMSDIHLAILGNGHGDINLLEKTLISCKADLDRQDAHGRTPLWWAVTRRDLQAVDILLRYGADLDAVDSAGYSPLLQSVSVGDIDVTAALLKHGPNVHQKTRWHRNILHLAAGRPDPSLLRFLLDSDLGVDLEEKNINGNSPLATACHFDYVDVAEVLISSGADLETLGYSQNTPLIFCLHRQCWNAFKLLLSRGADPTVRDISGNNVLAVAAKSKSSEAMKLLTSACPLGIDVDNLNEDGMSAWDYIRDESSQEVRDAFEELVRACRNAEGRSDDEIIEKFYDALEAQE